MSKERLWQRYTQYLCVCEPLGLSLDVSRMHFSDRFFEEQAGPIGAALEAMRQLEAGAIANPDEQRMVGHYWLRNAELAPTEDIRRAIAHCRERIKTFADDVHGGRVLPPAGQPFRNFLLIGIGGSALGPQFVDDALRTRSPASLRAFFCDNTDPDGIERTLVYVLETSGQ